MSGLQRRALRERKKKKKEARVRPAAATARPASREREGAAEAFLEKKEKREEGVSGMSVGGKRRGTARAVAKKRGGGSRMPLYLQAEKK